MKREFIHTSIFDKQWKDLGLGDDELAELQGELAESPKLAPVIQGTGGVRKVRFAFKNKGKSGSIRTLYIDLETHCVIYLLFAYAKSEKENISEKDKHEMHEWVNSIKKEYNGGKKQ